MKDLNRFEYLQLAAALMPEAEKIRLIKESTNPEDPYLFLSRGIWSLAKSIRSEYNSFYEFTSDKEFDLNSPIEKHKGK